MCECYVCFSSVLSFSGSFSTLYKHVFIVLTVSLCSLCKMHMWFQYFNRKWMPVSAGAFFDAVWYMDRYRLSLLKSMNAVFSFQICVTKMSTRNCQGMDSVIKPLDTIPEDKKVRVQRTQSSFDPFEKPTNQVKRVHSENNACINFKTSSAGKESPKVRRHSSPSSVSLQYWCLYMVELVTLNLP